MTHDAETVERVAKAIKNADASFFSWDQTTPVEREIYRNTARAALSALPPQEVGVQEAAKVADERADHYAAKADTYRGGSLSNTHYKTLCSVARSIAGDIRALSENPHE